jgi:hypothetical protein
MRLNNSGRNIFKPFILTGMMEEKIIVVRKDFCDTIGQDILVFEGRLSGDLIRNKLNFSNLYTFWGIDSDKPLNSIGRVTYTFGSEREERIILGNVSGILKKEGFQLDDLCLGAPIEFCYQQRCCSAWRRGIFLGF